MNETKRNFMRDIVCNFENLQECLNTLLAEEEHYRKKLPNHSGAEYQRADAACRGLERTIRLLDDVISSADSIM